MIGVIKEKKGITLIALIITVVILLILSSIIISSVSNENGIIAKIREAKSRINESQINEQVQLITLAARLENNELDPKKFISSIENNLTDDFEFDGINVIIHKETKKEFVISKDYGISSIIEITSVEDLKNVVSNGNYKLMNDINLSGIEWSPLASFSGTFNGNNYSINGMTINMPESYNLGLFKELNGGIVKNLALTNVDIKGYREVGALAGAMTNGALVENCFVTGNLDIYAYSGGITAVIINDSIIRNCYTICNFSVSTEGGIWASTGGIASYSAWGTSYGIIENCYSTSTINAKGYYVGGIMGYNEYNNNIRNCYALNSSISGNGVGRIVSNTNGENNYAYKDMKVNEEILESTDINSKNGLDITVENAKTQSHYETNTNWKFNDDGPWTFNYENMNVEEDTNLPILKSFKTVMQNPKI